jgi:hypothetical protein
MALAWWLAGIGIVFLQHFLKNNSLSPEVTCYTKPLPRFPFTGRVSTPTGTVYFTKLNSGLVLTNMKRGRFI